MVEPEGYLNKRVVTKEAYIINDKIIKIGTKGTCTADLDDVFAVKFDNSIWVSFHNEDIRNNFEICEE